MRLAKTTGIPIFIVGHVTKDGTIAGPRVLEHLVDTVLYFEGDSHHSFRILRAYKNRFGSTNEIAIFEMREKGLIEVENPSQIFLSERANNVSGSVIVPIIEGTRPILVELQALVSPTNFTNPQRRATGIDYNELVLLLAVLEKRAGLHISYYDVFVNVAGGVKIDEPASDLGLILAIASSFKDIPVDTKVSVIGEVGLGGEVRAVSQIERRVNEAVKLGFSKILIPHSNLKDLSSKNGQCIGVKTVQEALHQVSVCG